MVVKENPDRKKKKKERGEVPSEKGGSNPGGNYGSVQIGPADVWEALEIVWRGDSVTVVTDDSDTLVLLLYFWNSEMGQIFMLFESKKKIKLEGWKYCVDWLLFGNKYSQTTLFIYAWSCCDTTSAIFN